MVRNQDRALSFFHGLPGWEAALLAVGLPGIFALASFVFTDALRDLPSQDETTPVVAPFVEPAAPRSDSQKPEAAEPTFFHYDDAIASSGSPESGAMTMAQQLVALLESGRKTLEEARDFRGVLHKQERLVGVLGEQEEVTVLMRREPMAVYLHWEAPSGKELLWRAGCDDGKLLLHPGGWKGRLTPVLRIEPGHRLVKALTRRPLEKIGLWSLARELEERRASLERPSLSITATNCTGPDGRECRSFQIMDRERRADDEDHITVVYVDRAWRIAVGCEVYGWPEEGETEPPLLESYFYSQIEFNVGLSDRDFDPANPAYGFAQATKAVR